MERQTIDGTLTVSGSQAAIAIDTITLTANQRVLVKDQSTTTSKWYLLCVQQVGDGSRATGY